MDLMTYLSVDGILSGIATFFLNIAAYGQYMLDFLVIFGVANIVWGFILWVSHSIKIMDFLMRIGRSVFIFIAVFVLCNVLHIGLL